MANKKEIQQLSEKIDSSVAKKLGLMDKKSKFTEKNVEEIDHKIKASANKRFSA